MYEMENIQAITLPVVKPIVNMA